MADDFFSELGETISKTAKDISTKADSFLEGQKTRTKIATEQRMIDKSMNDMGNMVYKKYVDGEAIDEELTDLCEDITQRKITIAKYRETMAGMKGRKVCPACGASVPAQAAYCMYCGTPCESEEEEVSDEQPASEEGFTGNVEDEIRREAEVDEAEDAMEKDCAEKYKDESGDDKGAGEDSAANTSCGDSSAADNEKQE